MLFPENLSTVAKADAVWLETLVQRSSNLFWHLEKEDQRAGTLAAAEHREDEHLNDSFYTKSPYTRFKTGGTWNHCP